MRTKQTSLLPLKIRSSIVKDYRLVMECGITAMVECTGNTAVSTDAAIIALKKGINVYMVSKETDSVCGPILNQIAAENNAVYALVNGDQPRNLLDLYSWAKLLGLDVIAVGKSSEYDFVWDRETGEMTYTDGSGRSEQMRQMLDCWRYKELRHWYREENWWRNTQKLFLLTCAR